MKRGAIIGLLLISIFLISGINSCVPEELDKQVVSALKLKYSNISDYSISIKETENKISSCRETFVKKPDKIKSLSYSTCEKELNKTSTFIYAGNISLFQEYNPKIDKLASEITRIVYPFNIGKNLIEEFPFESLVENIFRYGNEITLIGEESYTPLGLTVYHLRIQIPKEQVVADLWVDKETYMMVKFEGTEQGRLIIYEIEKMEINQGLPDSVFELPVGVPVIEELSQFVLSKQKCENACKNKYTACQQNGQGIIEGKYYTYCEETFGATEIDYNMSRTPPHCWESPLNVQCPEIDCNEVLSDFSHC